MSVFSFNDSTLEWVAQGTKNWNIPRLMLMERGKLEYRRDYGTDSVRRDSTIVKA